LGLLIAFAICPCRLARVGYIETIPLLGLWDSPQHKIIDRAFGLGLLEATTV